MLKINGAKPKMNNAFPDSFCHSIPFIWMNKKRTRVVCLVFFRRYSLFRLGQNVMRFVVCVCVYFLLYQHQCQRVWLTLGTNEHEHASAFDVWSGLLPIQMTLFSRLTNCGEEWQIYHLDRLHYDGSPHQRHYRDFELCSARLKCFDYFESQFIYRLRCLLMQSVKMKKERQVKLLKIFRSFSLSSFQRAQFGYNS